MAEIHLSPCCPTNLFLSLLGKDLVPQKKAISDIGSYICYEHKMVFVREMGN